MQVPAAVQKNVTNAANCCAVAVVHHTPGHPAPLDHKALPGRKDHQG